MSKFKSLWSSKSQDWRTPEGLLDLLDEEFDFDMDPCPVNSRFNGLEVVWGECNFINPPYKDVAKWVKKGYEESLKGKICVFLVAARVDTRWFHDIVLPYAKEIRFIRGRLKFSGNKNSAPFPSMIVIFDEGKIP
jgi:site-specific DNA-methyltransferase (adenine-specific)